MSNTLQQPQTPEEQAEVDYGQHLIWRLVGSRIKAFGANAVGEILLSVEKDGTTTELVVGKDADGEIALFEIDNKEEPNDN